MDNNLWLWLRDLHNSQLRYEHLNGSPDNCYFHKPDFQHSENQSHNLPLLLGKGMKRYSSSSRCFAQCRYKVKLMKQNISITRAGSLAVRRSFLTI